MGYAVYGVRQGRQFPNFQNQGSGFSLTPVERIDDRLRSWRESWPKLVPVIKIASAEEIQPEVVERERMRDWLQIIEFLDKDKNRIFE